jgi:elongation factor 1 alpha-like protein
MSNRRVKSLAYDDDDLDDGYDDDNYDEGEANELSPEDKEQMRQGTIKVRSALGSELPATDAEIQEALWNYYYDVAKSVAYIKSESSGPRPVVYNC